MPSTTTEDFQYVNRLAISQDGKVLLAATPYGPLPQRRRRAATWTKVLNEAMADVDFHPTAKTQAVAGGLNNGQGYFSTDGGATWTRGDTPGHVERTASS